MKTARIAALLLLLQSLASADDVTKRELPDYDGRGPKPTTVGEVLLWLPRVVVSPLYLVTEFLLRRPAEVFIETAERNQWPVRVFDFLFDRPIGIIPTFYLDLGFHPTVGLYFFWNGLGAPANQIRATASIGFDNVSATATDRLALDGGIWRLALRGHFSSRSDNMFYGLGPLSHSADRSRYEARILEASVGADWRFARPSLVGVTAGARSVSFGGDGCCGDPTLAEEAATGAFALPEGFAAGGYGGQFVQLRLVLDSRQSAPQSGLRLELTLEEGNDVGSGDVWSRVAVTAAASLDVGRRRVFSLVLHGESADPLSGRDIPFTEQATLGAVDALPAFAPGRLIGRTDLAGTLRYEWPVWAYLEGVAHVGVGNVFGARFDGLDPGLFRVSTGIGLRSIGASDHRFELLLAFGTSPFDQGGGLDSVRLIIGGVTGF